MNSRFGLLVILVFFCFSAAAQIGEPSPVFRNLNADDGMPSNEIYHIIQDSIGYIWMATDNGVSRYDGYTFKNYGIEDGLIESIIHEIFIDYKGRYWFVSNSGRLAYMEHGVINPYKHNDIINEYVNKTRGTVKRSFYVYSLNTVYLSLASFGYLSITEDGVVNEYKPEEYGARTLIEKIDTNVFIVSFTDVLGEYTTILKTPEKISPIASSIQSISKESPFHSFFIRHNAQEFTLVTRAHLIRLKGVEVVDYISFPTAIIWASIDNDNNLWVTLNEGGVVMYEQSDFLSGEKRSFLHNEIVTSITQDIEGGYWFSTLTNGVFYSPNIRIPVYGEKQGLPSSFITSVFVNKSGVFVGNNLGSLVHMDEARMQVYQVELPQERTSPIRFITSYSDDNTIWIGSAIHLHSISNERLGRHYLTQKRLGASYPRQLIQSLDGEYWIASSWGIRKFNGKEFSYNSREENEFSGMVYTVYQDSANTLWLGTSNGLWQYKNHNYQYLGDRNALFAQPANHILEFDNRMLIATKGIGLIVVAKDTLFSLTQKEGLVSNYINKIAIDSSTIWLATKNGISSVELNSQHQAIIKNIDISKGLPTNEVNDIFSFENRIYAATPKGLCVFEKTMVNLPKSTHPKTYITNLHVNGHEVDNFHKHISLKHNENYLSISFVGFNYRKMGNVNYNYRLLGLDSLWITSNSPSTTFSGLSPGAYTFQVRAKGLDDTWYSAANVSFTILPPFWKRIWFIVLMASLLTGFLFFVYQMRISANKKRNQLINNLNTYKLQSLRQQMNPHFIFNTLNSIQLFILEKDHESSHKYLTKFAKLMRLVLDNSQQTSVTLKNELEALELYLELESVRLAGRFQYFIQLENEEMLDLRVPGMLIQPFVENSIWHGIMLKHNREGWVKISFSYVGDSLICVIEDNGVGREEAQQVSRKKNKGHKSLGTSITDLRIQTMNSLHQETFSITYHDLVNEMGAPTGTKVEIKMPISVLEDEYAYSLLNLK